jgi:hypothetical protein
MPCFENGSSARLGHGRGKHPIIKDVLIPNLDSLVKELEGKREKMKLNNITN